MNRDEYNRRITEEVMGEDLREAAWEQAELGILEAVEALTDEEICAARIARIGYDAGRRDVVLEAAELWNTRATSTDRRSIVEEAFKKVRVAQSAVSKVASAFEGDEGSYYRAAMDAVLAEYEGDGR